MSGNWARETTRFAIYMRDEFVCAYCRTPITQTILTLDHLVARSAGGGNEASNLITACDPCNMKRGATPWQIFADKATRRRIARLRAKPLQTEAVVLLFHFGPPQWWLDHKQRSKALRNQDRRSEDGDGT